MNPSSSWPLAGASIVIEDKAPALLQFAARELARYLYVLTGRPSPVVDGCPRHGVAIVLDPGRAKAAGVRARQDQTGEQGYRIAAVSSRGLRQVVIAGGTPVGVLYGVYGLLEQLGVGFYAGGDTFPETPVAVHVDVPLDVIARPSFAVRGNMLHYNFLCGCTDWGLSDYKFYFDQLARMRCNMLLMHWYDGEPGAAYQVKGEYLAGGVTPNSLTRPWGAVSSLRTSQFSFGSGRCFDEEIYSSPAGEDLPDLLTEVKRTERMFSEASRYARGAGIEIAAGFEAPREDPEARDVRERFRARLLQFVERNPHLTRFALWQHESGGCVGTPPPAAGSPGSALFQNRRGDFAYLGNDQRIWEAIRYGRFAEMAVSILEREAPKLKIVLVGWGGDRWMQFADYCLGYDRMLPDHVAFTCHDNIDASMGPTVSGPWGQLPPGRERWAMPWVEGDIDECASRQPNVESLGRLAPDARRKGCQGLLTLQWRTRDVEEETGYIAQYAWDPTLTPDRFYRRLARNAFGADQERRMGGHLATLQRLGSHWTGVRGTVECGAMRWTGWLPHMPFEVNGEAALRLASMADEAAQALAEIPRTVEGEAAFHLLPQEKQSAEITRDRSRPGVAELEQAAYRLRVVSQERIESVLRADLAAVEESVYAVRPRLVAFGMAGRAYRAIDGFLIAIHHVWRSAGARRRFAKVRRIRRDLDALGSLYRRQGRAGRLERLDYLAATIDFLLPYDTAAMMLADGESVEQALVRAEQLKAAGDPRQAAEEAAEAYRGIVDSRMDHAVAALGRKLTTRCDFGTLTTFNVKQLGLYWETFRRIEAYLPAVPPREVRVRGLKHEMWISWQPAAGIAGQRLYRRAEGGNWRRVCQHLLRPGTSMFTDRPAGPGRYEYAVTAVDKDGWESPRSHGGGATCGRLGHGPQIVACKPFSRLDADVPLPIRVVCRSDRDIAEVVLVRRSNGGSWERIAMAHRFRDSFSATLGGDDIRPGVLEFYVEARDEDGEISHWPETAPKRAWSVTVLPARG